MKKVFKKTHHDGQGPGMMQQECFNLVLTFKIKCYGNI